MEPIDAFSAGEWWNKLTPEEQANLKKIQESLDIRRGQVLDILKLTNNPPYKGPEKE